MECIAEDDQQKVPMELLQIVVQKKKAINVD